MKETLTKKKFGSTLSFLYLFVFCCRYKKSELVPSRHVSQVVYDQFLSPSCAPIGAAQSLLETVHLYTGLPWWATIAATTVFLRTVLTVPLMAYSFNNSAKLQLLMPKIKELQEELKTEVAVAMKMKGWSQEYAMGEFRRNVRKLCTTVT